VSVFSLLHTHSLACCSLTLLRSRYLRTRSQLCIAGAGCGDGDALEIELHTEPDLEPDSEQLSTLRDLHRLYAHRMKLTVVLDFDLHDRSLELSNGWSVTLGRGLDIYPGCDVYLYVCRVCICVHMNVNVCLSLSVCMCVAFIWSACVGGCDGFVVPCSWILPLFLSISLMLLFFCAAHRACICL
jgi:hypothetical protein